MRFAAKGTGEESGTAPDEPTGELAARVHDVAARAFSTGDEPR